MHCTRCKYTRATRERGLSGRHCRRFDSAPLKAFFVMAVTVDVCDSATVLLSTYTLSPRSGTKAHQKITFSGVILEFDVPEVSTIVCYSMLVEYTSTSWFNTPSASMYVLMYMLGCCFLRLVCCRTHRWRAHRGSLSHGGSWSTSSCWRRTFSFGVSGGR